MACSHGVHDVPLLFDIAFGVDILGRAKNPLDVKMFQFTNWRFEEGGNHVSDQTNPKYDTIAEGMACSHGVHDVPLLFDIAFGVGILGRAKKPVTEDGLDVLGARIVTRGKRFVCFRVRSLSWR
jgi:hypothetical protein